MVEFMQCMIDVKWNATIVDDAVDLTNGSDIFIPQKYILSTLLNK